MHVRRDAAGGLQVSAQGVLLGLGLLQGRRIVRGEIDGFTDGRAVKGDAVDGRFNFFRAGATASGQ